MIVEHALLSVRDGQSAAFEAAMRQAIPLIAASSGFLGIEVRPAVEAAGLYLLLVRWDDVSSHREGFRTSDRYQEWRALLHGFYEPMPRVDYFGPSLIDSPAPSE
ncbi:antibiotic biosynthesis monooxygenase family protein [Sphingomonas sp. MMS24-J13]|uniref:antibiotic biosynthesis monooxygenase family protein n=1 Tax=Sphingomonas sp. MMS24-J13 TaxID=3238686 RepID=UPI00384C82F9